METSRQLRTIWSKCAKTGNSWRNDKEGKTKAKRRGAEVEEIDFIKSGKERGHRMQMRAHIQEERGMRENRKI